MRQAIQRTVGRRGILRASSLWALCVVLASCAGGCPELRSLGDGAPRFAADGHATEVVHSAAALRDLTGDLARVVAADPHLSAQVVAVAEDWRPLLEQHGRGRVITSGMVDRVEALLPVVLAAADDELARRVKSIVSRVDLRALVGASAEEALQTLLEAIEATTVVPQPTFSLAARERGLARSGETVLVPATAHVSGAQGTRWRTDLMVVNPSSVPAAFTVAMLRRDADNSTPQQVDVELGAGEAVLHEDVLDSLFSFSGAASLRLTVTSGAVTVTSRTYNLLGAGNSLGLPPGSTFGQFVPAFSDDDAIPSGDEGHLIQLSHDPDLGHGARANLILVNGGAPLLSAEVDLHRSDGITLGRVIRQLRAWEYIQLDRVFEEVTPQAIDNGYAVVRPATPGGRLFALASVVDNLTGDPIAVPPTLASYQAETTLAETLTIPAAAHVAGATGTNWRTDLVLHHLSGPNTLALVSLLRRGQANPLPEERQVTVTQGQAVRFDDVLVSLFDTEGAAALRVTPYGGPLAVSSRTYNLLGAGNPQGLPEGSTFGQYLAPIGWLSVIRFGEKALLGQLSHDPSLQSGSRTNLVLVNNATRDADYEVELYRSDGSSLGSFTTTLAQWEYQQIDRVFERVTDESVDGGYAVVRALSPWGYFHTQASVVDNRTGDPVTVDAIPIRAPEQGGLVESWNMLFDALADGSLPMRESLLQLTDSDVESLLDALSTALPDHVTRTPHGVVVDAGLGEATDGGYVAGGRIELSLSDDFASGGGEASGTFTLTFDGFHVDGLAPVVETVQGNLELARVENDNVAGTVTLGHPGAAPVDVTGGFSIDTRICAAFPINGTVSVVIGGETRTINLSDVCNGSYGVQIPSAQHYKYEMRVRNCDGSWNDQWDVIFMIDESGRLAADPSAPIPYGRGTWTVRGKVPVADASLRFARPAARSPDGVERVGWFRGGRNEPVPGTVYWSGVYAYRVRDDTCSAYHNHSRQDPDFSAAILQPCDGACAP